MLHRRARRRRDGDEALPRVVDALNRYNRPPQPDRLRTGRNIFTSIWSASEWSWERCGSGCQRTTGPLKPGGSLPLLRLPIRLPSSSTAALRLTRSTPTSGASRQVRPGSGFGVRRCATRIFLSSSSHSGPPARCFRRWCFSEAWVRSPVQRVSPGPARCSARAGRSFSCRPVRSPIVPGQRSRTRAPRPDARRNT